MKLEVIFIVENAPLKLTDVSTMVLPVCEKRSPARLLCPARLLGPVALPKKLAPWVQFKL